MHPRLFFSPSVFWLIVSALSTPLAQANVTLGTPFATHAVLQRDKSVPVWGTAAPGEKISVSFAGQTRETVAGANGRWLVQLDALPARREGRALEVRGNDTITIHDVVVGEVWLCSGQSNMTFPMERSDGAKAEIPSANFPLIRQFGVAQTPADQPADLVKGAWRICSPETVGRFTAVGYYFARELFADLNVPIGLVHCAWGGTPIESWISPQVLASQPAFHVVAERWQKDLAAKPANQAAYDAILTPWLAAEAKAKNEGAEADRAYLANHPRPVIPANLRDSSSPGSLYNGMVHPLIPYALRGVIWYQGEGNTGHADEYHRLFAAMITSWRTDFGQGDFPFYWVNLANFKGGPTGETSARVREAQTQTLSLPQTGQALAIDIGNPIDIHPTNKKEVGHRLALIARACTYGRPVEYCGPQFASATVEAGAMQVHLTHAAGLCARGSEIHALELAGADRKFFPASGTIHGDSLRVSSPEVKKPVAVRYAFQNNPDANLYNGAGLPAVPFRTDTW